MKRLAPLLILLLAACGPVTTSSHVGSDWNWDRPLPATQPESPDEPPTVVDPTPTYGDDECKPGWGKGDKNHCHSGPPGRR